MKLLYFLLMVSAIFSGQVCTDADTIVKKRSAEEFSKLIAEKGTVLLDVRTAEEFAEGHISGALNIDINKEDFAQRAATLNLQADTPLAIYCRSGRRSANACSILAEQGFRNISDLSGGIIGWLEAGKSTSTTDMKTVYEFIKACGHYFIATTEGNQPRVRPFGTIHIFEGKLYIQTGHVKDVAKQIEANGKCELCCYNGSEWLRLSGTLVEDKRVEAKKSMLDAYPELRSMYDENDDNTAVYYFTDAVARICSFTNPEEIIRF